VGGANCGIEFGGTVPDCAQLYPALAAIFQSVAQANQVEPVCRRLKIDVLVVTSGDPVWNIPDSWVWKRYPLISTGNARAFLMKTPVFAEKQ
jgi:hypothetical protein